MPAIGVVLINLCKCGLVGIRGGSGRGGGIRGWEDNSTRGRDSGFSVSRINAARSSLRDKKLDGHIRSPCCHVMRGLRIGFRNAKRNRARSPRMYCTNHRAWSSLLSLSNSIVFAVNGSLREAFGGVGWSLGTSFGGRGGDGGADPVNIIASCKAGIAAARATVSPVDGTGKGTRPTTSSPSVSYQETRYIHLRTSSMWKISHGCCKKKIVCYMYLIHGTYDQIVNVRALHTMH